MNKMPVGILVAAFLCISLASQAVARPPVPVQNLPNEKFDSARTMIMDALSARATVSAAVGVAQDGKIVWLQAFGMANGPRRVKTTTHTAYPVASITKPLTATAIMLLAERGELDINESAEKYIKPLKFKAYRGKSEDVTIKHLLNHTSGLPMHFNYFYDDEGYEPPSIEETVERYGFLMHAPGEVFQYSNLGYGVLGHIISKVSGMTYEEFMEQEVFALFGMGTSWIGFLPDRELFTAEKYGPDFQPIPHIEMDTPAAGQAFVTAFDLLRFGMLHLKNSIPSSPGVLSPEIVDAMQHGMDETARYTGDPYGLGWFIREDDFGLRTVWHEGGIGGARSIIKLVPSENIAVVVLLNSWNDDLPGRVANEVIATLVPGFRERMEEGAPPASSGFEAYEALPEFTGRWKGEIRTYAGDVPVYMVFQKDGDIHFLKELDIDRTWVLQNQGYFDRVLNNTGISGNRIYGWVDGLIPTSDAMREPQVLVVDIVREGDKMSGSVSSLSAAERMYYGLSYYVELEKQ